MSPTSRKAHFYRDSETRPKTQLFQPYFAPIIPEEPRHMSPTSRKAHTDRDCWCKPTVIEHPSQVTVIHNREAKDDPRKTG
jgi:hypothetical protein